jgi:exonuclease III
MIQIDWLESCMTSILNIYTLNKRNAHPEFWAKITTEKHLHHLPTPDFTLGDFNVTEEALDQNLPKNDNAGAIVTLREVKNEWDIQDTWRHVNPDEKGYTYRAQTHNKQIQARLNCILYIQRNKSSSTPLTEK